MVRMHAMIVQEIPEEVVGRESEASLEVGDEDHPLIRFRRRHSLADRKLACHSNRDTLCVDDPVEVRRDNFRSLPARTVERRSRIILQR
jgi:hypothetical protein